MNAATISPSELEALSHNGKVLDLIDVRTPAEFEEVHARFARNVPLDRLSMSDVSAAAKAGTEPLHVICQTGSRGRQACERLMAAGVARVVNVDGGTRAWVAAGLPVTRGRRAISLERQVRIAAGSLVVIGVVLGWLIHPAFIGLSGFVGAGLVFAGITDTCGMGMLLARMPWNHRPAAKKLEQRINPAVHAAATKP